MPVNALQAMLAVLGLVAASASPAADSPRKSGKSEPAADASIVSPLNVWNDATGEGEPPLSAKYVRLAQRIIKKYDRDGSGTLRANEWPPAYGKMADADANHDGVVTVDELAEYLARYARLHPLRKPDTAWQHLPRPPADLFQPVTQSEGDPKAADADDAPPKEQAKLAASPVLSGGATAPDDKKPRKTGGTAQRTSDTPKKYYVSPSALPAGLPDWFHELDTDGDGQLTLGEFAPDGSPARRRLFQRYDENGDGVITPDEVLRFSKATPETKPTSPNAAAGAKK